LTTASQRAFAATVEPAAAVCEHNVVPATTVPTAVSDLSLRQTSSSADGGGSKLGQLRNRRDSGDPGLDCKRNGSIVTLSPYPAPSRMKGHLVIDLGERPTPGKA
jgi:hypothetical protein